ncbi:hypothetical protein KI387_006579, partial [Taxus chinensis]
MTQMQKRKSWGRENALSLDAEEQRNIKHAKEQSIHIKLKGGGKAPCYAKWHRTLSNASHRSKDKNSVAVKTKTKIKQEIKHSFGPGNTRKRPGTVPGPVWPFLGTYPGRTCTRTGKGPMFFLKCGKHQRAALAARVVDWSLCEEVVLWKPCEAAVKFQNYAKFTYMNELKILELLKQFQDALKGLSDFGDCVHRTR